GRGSALAREAFAAGVAPTNSAPPWGHLPAAAFATKVAPTQHGPTVARPWERAWERARARSFRGWSRSHKQRPAVGAPARGGIRDHGRAHTAWPDRGPPAGAAHGTR